MEFRRIITKRINSNSDTNRLRLIDNNNNESK